MLFISARDELNNEDDLARSLSYWNLKIRNQVEIVSDRTQIELSEVKDRLNGKSVLIVVHGYNNEFEDITRAYDIIRLKISQHAGDWYDEVVGFTWPGGDNALDWYAPKRRAGVVAPRLANFLEDLAGDVQNVDLMSHSLGARVVLGALNVIPEGIVRANFLTASAVDNEVIEQGEKYFTGVRDRAAESVVFHSKYDFVLKSAYRIAEWDNPLGLNGPENPENIIEYLPNVDVVNCKNVIKGHGEYKSSDEVYQFINRWMNGEVRTQYSTLRRLGN